MVHQAALPYRVIIVAVLLALSLICIIPLLAVVSISLTDEGEIVRSGYHLIPVKFDLAAYRYVLGSPDQILRSYLVTITVTILGTILSVLIMGLLAFALSRKDFYYRKHLTIFVFFTMLFNGGLIPWYILIARYLHGKDHLWVLILPYLVSPWYVLILRTFFWQMVSSELIESGKIDGATDLRIFLRIIAPIAKPALATIALFVAFMYWNDWWLGMLFIETPRLMPLQYMLQRIMSSIQFLTTQLTTNAVSIDLSKLPNESARMAMCVLAAGPMLFVFPFFQRYFVKGLTVGAIKG